ncbi:unnamed protein product, partial [Staurois parvus]
YPLPAQANFQLSALAISILSVLFISTDHCIGVTGHFPPVSQSCDLALSC